jgi:hypothetical protein
MGWQASAPAGPPAPRPPRLGRLRFFPGWAGVPASRAGHFAPVPAWAGIPAGLPGLPSWAPGRRPRLGLFLVSRLGSMPAGLLSRLGRIQYVGWVTSCTLFRLGQAGIPWPRPDYYPPGPGFTPSGILCSSGIDSTAWCQSWDASGLGLAHPSSSYAGLGTLLSSDQHIPLLLVSLILRRRIRLMTW